MRIMPYNNLIMQMALLFSAEEDVIYTNIGVGHLLLSTLTRFDIQIDSFVSTFAPVWDLWGLLSHDCPHCCHILK